KNVLGDHTVLTDDDGRFSLRGVAPGVRTIYAQSAVAGKGEAQVTLREGDELLELQVRLSASLETDDAEFSRTTGSVALAFAQSEHGPVITSVPTNGEAERAGLRAGDIVSHIDGALVSGSRAAHELLR